MSKKGNICPTNMKLVDGHSKKVKKIQKTNRFERIDTRRRNNSNRRGIGNKT